MSKQNEPSSKKPRHPDFIGAEAAMRRAARRAHLIAHQAGTGVVVMRNGKVVEIEPDPEMYNDIGRDQT